jgi:hypothetical protein
MHRLVELYKVSNEALETKNLRLSDQIGILDKTVILKDSEIKEIR